MLNSPYIYLRKVSMLPVIMSSRDVRHVCKRRRNLTSEEMSITYEFNVDKLTCNILDYFMSENEDGSIKNSITLDMVARLLKPIIERLERIEQKSTKKELNEFGKSDQTTAGSSNDADEESRDSRKCNQTGNGRSENIEEDSCNSSKNDQIGSGNSEDTESSDSSKSNQTSCGSSDENLSNLERLRALSSKDNLERTCEITLDDRKIIGIEINSYFRSTKTKEHLHLINLLMKDVNLDRFNFCNYLESALKKKDIESRNLG